MVKIDKRFILQILMFFILLLNSSIQSQSGIDLPNKIQIFVNGSEISLTESWIDSLVNDAIERTIFYKIVGAARANSLVTTQVQIPQFFSLKEVYRQVVLYYTFLQDEDTRESEILNIYPYFESTNTKPAIRCRYVSKRKYDIEIEYWHQIPIPDQPRVEDRDIFNQILQISFHEVESIGDVSNDVFEKVAEKNKLPVERVKTIYQNTILWQLGNQIYSQ